MKICTFTTDFGLQDSYVATMKGRILSIVPDVQLIDISHLVPAQDIVLGQFVLGSAWKSFPKGTVHLAVVDPDVGCDRKRIIVEAGEHFFVGPDNGLFGFVMNQETKTFWELKENVAQNASSTFEGRDIFAPVAAKLLLGESLHNMAVPIEEIKVLSLLKVSVTKKTMEGHIIAIDHFGNCITNLTRTMLSSQAIVRIGRRRIGEIRRTYSDVAPKKFVALWNSLDHLEISQRCGSAARALHAKRGMKVTVLL